MEILVAPQGSPRTKPRALNVALPLARGRYTVVYDAEDIPDPGQLRLAVARFAQLPRNVACLQARLTIDNTDDTWLTRLFTIEYAALFDAFNPGLAEIGSPLPLGGTSNHFRTSVLRDIHGWDAWNVTEDADLGIRLARLGYAVKDLPSSTLEEAPGTLGAWMRQRTRWMKGFVQTATSHSRKPRLLLRQLGIWKCFGALCLTWGIALSALVYPLFSGLILIWWLSEATWLLTSQKERIVFSLCCRAFGVRRRVDLRSGLHRPAPTPAMAAPSLDAPAPALLRARQHRGMAGIYGSWRRPPSAGTRPAMGTPGPREAEWSRSTRQASSAPDR